MRGNVDLVAREALPSVEKGDGSAAARLWMRGNVDLVAREAAPSEERGDGTLCELDLVAREAIPSEEKGDRSAAAHLRMPRSVDPVAREAVPSEEKGRGTRRDQGLVAREALPSEEKGHGIAAACLSMRRYGDRSAREALPSEERGDGSAAACLRMLGDPDLVARQALRSAERDDRVPARLRCARSNGAVVARDIVSIAYDGDRSQDAGDHPMPRHAKATKIARDEGMIAGITKTFPEDEKFIIRGVWHTPQTLAAEYRQHLELLREVTTREVEWRTAVDQERKLEASLKGLHEYVKMYLAGRFGPSSPALRAFGLKPQKKAVTSVETKTLAIMKRLETRKLRKTMGKKQRKKIKGTM